MLNLLRGPGLWVLLCLCSGGIAGAVLPQAAAAQAGEGGAFVDSIRVEGNRRVAAETILSTAAIQAGSFVTFRNVQEGTKALMRTGEFADVRVRVEGREGAAVVLVLAVAEHPQVRRIVVDGLERVRTGEVLDSAGLRSNAPFSPVAVAKARSYIRQRLSKDGIPFARVEEELRPVGQARDTVDLVLQVEEGNRVTVAEFRVEGDRAVGEDEIAGAMETRREGFLWFRSGQFDQAILDEDLSDRLPAFFGSRGHLDFRVLGDTLIIDPETGKSRLELRIDEGPRYRLGEFAIEGNRRFPTDQLRQYFDTESRSLLESLRLRRGSAAAGGEAFDSEAFQEAGRSVEQLYKNSGYLYARVEPVLDRRAPEEEGGEPVVDVSWSISEQNPAYVKSVRILGNDYTHDRVIREQISLLPGDTYSEALLIQSWQAIQALGFFESPMPPPDIQPDPETGDVDLIFTVKEKQTGSVNFGTAIGGGTGVAGFLGYDQPNLFGQAKSGNLRWDFGRYSNNFTLSYTDPALLQSRTSGSFSLFNSRDRFFRFDTGQRRRIGGLMRFGLAIPNARFTRLFLGYSLSRTRYDQNENADDASLFGLPPGTQSQFSVGVVRQTVNHPIFPTSGSRQSLNSEFNGGILGGDGDFIRHLVEGTWYVPAGQLGGGTPGSRPVQFALGLSLKGGAVFGDARRFPFDRFWMGGVQFGQRLRGYDETTITPLGYFDRTSTGVSDLSRLGDAYLTITGDYSVRFNDNIGISLFYDAGNVWTSPREIDPSRMFRGAGIGFQLVTPFGPLGLDYAYGFDKTEPGWQLHFRLGPGF